MTGPDPGWRTVRLGPVADLDSFYRELSAALALPDWFGHNLDALWEVLTELEQPTRLELPDVDDFRTRHPAAWARVQAVLTERAELPSDQAVPFVVATPPRRG